MQSSKSPLIFAVNKPSLMTSNDVLYYFKKNLNFDFGKIGHFGTLDPFASGLLLIGIQGAQKINEYIHELLPKTYFAKGFFGERTISGDLTSEVIELKDIELNWKNIDHSNLENLLKDKFLGDYWQRPHQISATKFQGKRLYDHAKSGTLIQKEKVLRKIFDLKITKYEYPYVEFFITVSSGTYIRSFFEDVSEFMGGVGHLKDLVRTSVGDISLDKSISKPFWPTRNTDYAEILKISYKIDQTLRLNRIELDAEKARRFLQGVRFRADQVEIVRNDQCICSDKYQWVYDIDGNLLGLGQMVSSELQALFTYQNSNL
jgi:tRNA pseudouridine55 synthase